MNNIDKFKDRIKNLRKEFGITQQDLADKLGLVRTAIANYEMGRNIPNAETLNMIADFFDVSLDYLLGRTDIRKDLYTNRTDDKLFTDAEHEDNGNSKLFVAQKADEYKTLSEDIKSLSPESQEEIRKFIELYKIKEMQDRNNENKHNINGTE
ncbi:MAG: XRE family transcriptional regulator [Firmicutes bacterium HGW-Firmicutes-7]|nr:MAG: XRE family transcriptional regulator [Firmicutes bacterium HGW-Firmicutes-7]